MSTDTAELVELGINLDAEVPCQVQEGCENVATFIMTNECTSRHTFPCCAAHKNLGRDMILIYVCTGGHTIHCSLDDQPLPHPHATWRPL